MTAGLIAIRQANDLFGIEMLGAGRNDVSICDKIVVPLRAECTRETQPVHLDRRRSQRCNPHPAAITVAVEIDEDVDVAVGDSARAAVVGQGRDIEKMIGCELRTYPGVSVGSIREYENFALSSIVESQ